MKKENWKQFVRHVFLACFLVVGLLWAVSCKDEYTYDDEEPSWLGASIYDYLKNDGHFTYFVRLIEETGDNKLILSKTGSKTLFVANDSAFEKFFSNNPWGVDNYEKLSAAQKNLIISYCMINNAYLIETMSNYNTGGNSEGNLVLGQAMRRASAVDGMDTVPFEKGDQLPEGPFWKYYRDHGIYLLKDETSWPIVHFFQKMMDIRGMTNEDFEIITGFTRQKNDAYIFDKKVIKRDITCKNGYINVLNGLLIPPKNMADFIQNDPNLTIFSSIMDRFCAPYYDKEINALYKSSHPGFTDSIFVKKFYSTLNANVDGKGNPITSYPNNKPINSLLLLPYDPGWNSYHYFSSNPPIDVSVEADMATMIAPTNEAMDNYFNTGKGILLKERFGSWDKIPDNIIVMFLKKHMRYSFFGSLPSQFPQMLDNDGIFYNMHKEDIVSSYIGVNGLVYLTNKVYPPIDFESVFGPVLFGRNTRIFDWVIQNNRYRFYLNSPESRYSFLVPTDEYLKNYIDPFTISKTMQGALKFWYDTTTYSVKASVYKYNKLTNTIGDSVLIPPITENAFITNRLLKILDSHIVIGDIESGNKVYITKGNNTIWINGSGTDLTIQGGGDISFSQHVKVNKVFNQLNGTTYFIDRPIQNSLKSAYEILSSTPEFSEFFALLSGFPAESKSVIFVSKPSYYGSDFVVRFFNNFHYTVYVPTNEAIQAAISSGKISPWVSQPGITGINDMTNIVLRNEAIAKLERFLRYHFQDNSVSISGDPVSNKIYQTAANKIDDKVTHFNTFKNRYYKLGVDGNGSGLTLTTETNGNASVVTQNNLYNIYTCDYIFNDSPTRFADLTGNPVSAKNYSTSVVVTSSSAVIHQIDKVLLFE